MIAESVIKMMTIPLAVCLVVALMHQDTSAVITTSVNDFVVDCGSTPGGPVSITYTNSLPGNNTVVKMYSRGNLATCSDNDADDDDVYTIADVRASCTIANPSTAEYQIEITLQEVALLVQSTDPKYLFNCVYTAAAPVLITTDQYGTVFGGPATTMVIPVTIPADQIYVFELLDDTYAVTTVATFGEAVTLRVRMSGTDVDENGVQIKQMNVSSGAVSLNLIDDYCVAEPYKTFFPQEGFYSSGLEANFPLTLFALEGSESNDIVFTAELTICPSNCDGSNCPVAGKRKKRSAEDETTKDESLKLLTKLYVLPAGVKLPTSNHSTEDGSNALTCMQSFGFIVTVTVLTVLLLVATVTVVCMLTTRRSEQQKQGT